MSFQETAHGRATRIAQGPVLKTARTKDVSQDTAQVVFQPSGRRGRVPLGISLVEASRRLGEALESPCGESQSCGKCKVRIEQGLFEKLGIHSGPSNVSGWQEVEGDYVTKEEKDAGFRLGCAARVEGDLLVFVPEQSRAGKQVVSKAARPIDIRLDPAVRHYRVTVAPPGLEDPVADCERLCHALQQRFDLAGLTIDAPALRTLSGALREGKWTVTVSIWKGREIIRVQPGSGTGGYGLALDIGTTTVAGYLCDLETGAIVHTASMMNPQVKYGEDVMSRISYHMGQEDGLKQMSGDLVAALNRLLESCTLDDDSGATREQGRSPAAAGRILPDQIEDVAIACNTAMHHILLQLDPGPLGVLPFTPTIHHSLDLKARDLGLNVNPGAYVFMLPCVAGFVGGDCVGVTLAEAPQDGDTMQLIIDIGTNGEIVLGNRDRLLCTSCATGPALEGAQIEFGMRAAPGAIERVHIDPQTHEVDYKVVGRDAWRSYSNPQAMGVLGICGSGILDVAAQMLLAGVITKQGAFNGPGQRSNRLRTNPDSGKMEFVLAWSEDTAIGRDLVITQTDIRQIQLAKAAIYCGCKILMRELGLDQVDCVKIAGAFGTHVDRRLALVTGLFPDCPLERVQSVGNAAGDGCRVALLNLGKRAEADRISRRMEYVELTLQPDFQEQLIGAIHLPHMTDSFPSLNGTQGPETRDNAVDPGAK